MNEMQRSQKQPNKFILRLYKILNQSKYSNSISWTASGLSFSICNTLDFTLSVLPLYFNHKNYSSFIRQLNMYDFHKERDTETQIFYHPCFIRGHKDKLCHIQRKTSELLPKMKIDDVLEKKYNLISSKQELLIKKINELKQCYQEITLLNQTLFMEILKTQERQQKIEKVIIIYMGQFNEIPAFLKNFKKIHNK